MNQENKYSIKLSDSKDLEKYKGQPPIFGRVLIEIDEQKFAFEVGKVLAIDDKNLVKCMVEHASNYGWWASLGEEIRRALRAKKRAHDEKANELDQTARSALLNKGIKVTEAAVKSYMGNDPRLKTCVQDLADLEDIQGIVDAVLRGLEHKRDMLKEINRSLLNEQFNQRN